MYVPSPLYLILGIPRDSHDMSFQQPEEPNADVQAMLLANISKDDSFLSVIDSTQKAPAELSPSERVIDQLMDLFVKGQDGSYNKKANFDYLAYVFANLSKHERVRQYFSSPQDYDGVVPLGKIKVFTEHKSDVRRNRVRGPVRHHEIHDRVNYSVKESSTIIDSTHTNIELKLKIDTSFCSVMDYFEIFLDRMILCRKAAEKLGLHFRLNINGQTLL